MAGNKSKLSAITKELVMKWQQTRETWQDAKSTEFEHEYMEELVSGVDKAITVIEELDKLVLKIRRDCE
ncbi:MAG: hypothetical protein WCO56_18760 [Verrucomicrobiota bacterium]